MDKPHGNVKVQLKLLITTKNTKVTKVLTHRKYRENIFCAFLRALRVLRGESNPLIQEVKSDFDMSVGYASQ